MTLATRIFKPFCFLLLLFAAVQAFAVIETYDFDSEAQRERYQHFIDVLRCPKCQNQNLAGSNSPIAEDLRHELVRQLKAGKQDQEIIDFMVARYGEFVLYDPRFKKNTALLWLAPLGLLLVGLAVVFFILRHNRQLPEEAKAAVQVTTTVAPMAEDARARRFAFAVVAGAFLFVAGGSWVLYRQLGAGDLLRITALTQQYYEDVAKAGQENREPDRAPAKALVEVLKPYLATHRDDPNLFYLLGLTYTHLNDLDSAIPWYKDYLMAVPTDERVLTEYVQLLYLAAHQQLSERLLFVVDRALTLNPQNLEVLGLMAMHYQKAGQYSDAAPYWQRMLDALPPDAGSRSLIRRALAEGHAARHKAGNKAGQKLTN